MIISCSDGERSVKEGEKRSLLLDGEVTYILEKKRRRHHRWVSRNAPLQPRSLVFANKEVLYETYRRTSGGRRAAQPGSLANGPMMASMLSIRCILHTGYDTVVHGQAVGQRPVDSVSTHKSR